MKDLILLTILLMLMSANLEHYVHWSRWRDCYYWRFDRRPYSIIFLSTFLKFSVKSLASVVVDLRRKICSFFSYYIMELLTTKCSFAYYFVDFSLFPMLNIYTVCCIKICGFVVPTITAIIGSQRIINWH